MSKIKKNIINLYNILRLPEMLILPGNLAFFLILSLIPTISLIGIFASSLSLSTESLISYLSTSLPKEVYNILFSFINSTDLGTTSLLFFVVGFYVSSNGPDSLITASNILYKYDNDNYIFRRVKALFMTFFVIILFIFILIVLALN